MSTAISPELLAALLAAPEERRQAARLVLEGKEVIPAPPTGPLLLNMSNAAKFLGVSRATLWRTIRLRNIQKVELFPGSYRVRRADLEALVSTRRLTGES